MSMKIKSGRETITTKVAYMAGFFDGEGCVRIKKSSQKGNSYHIIAHVTNSNLKILQIFKYWFGGKIRLQEKTKNKNIYNYYITCAEACDMLKILLTFLYEKREQAELAIDFHNYKEAMPLKEKKVMYTRMRELKKSNIYENKSRLA